MRITILLLTLFTQLFFCSCNGIDQNKKAIGKCANASYDSVNEEKRKRLQEREVVEAQEKLDSIDDTELLYKALQIAKDYKQQSRFSKHFLEMMADSSYEASVDISCDYYFTKAYPHLLIKRSTPSALYIDVFAKEGTQFQKVISHELWKMEYTGETIRDVNGDGAKDFIVNRYGNTGCCLKAFSSVYLLRSDRRSFSSGFEFINPTFSPKEQVVRGICYGHPGETEMYKYKWNSEKIDTIEYVYFEKDDQGKKTGKLLVSNTVRFDNNEKIRKRLNAVPLEYKKIEGYDWFLGFE